MASQLTTSTSGPGLSLPLFLTHENKYLVGLGMFLIATILYLSSNHFPIFEPQLLPMSWIDRIVPLVPQTVFIYTSEYLLFPTVYLICHKLENANKYIYAFLGLQTISVLIFWIWPTTFPREQYPLPADMDPLTDFVFNWLRQTDSPGNCCPSLHVSSVYLSSFIFLEEQQKKFPFFFLWATAIAVTTLTTKQHYVIDIATGLLMAIIVYWFFYKIVNYYPLRTRQSGSRSPQSS